MPPWRTSHPCLIRLLNLRQLDGFMVCFHCGARRSHVHASLSKRFRGHRARNSHRADRICRSIADRFPCGSPRISFPLAIVRAGGWKPECLSVQGHLPASFVLNLATQCDFHAPSPLAQSTFFSQKTSKPMTASSDQ
jgi:hypothetical protein